MKPSRGLEPVSDLIDVVIAQVAHADVRPIMRLRREWGSVAGSLAAVTAPIRLDKGRLTVEVASGAVATKVRYTLDELLGNAQRVLGGEAAVSSVSIRVRRGSETAAATPDCPA